MTETDRAEFLGVFVDPGATQAELACQLPRVNELRPASAPLALAQELRDALGDRLDRLRRELLYGCP